MKTIAVYGGGSWGTALACQVARRYDEATIFIRDAQIVNEILTHRTNSKYLGSTLLPQNLYPTSKLANILNKEVIIIAVPSSAFISVLNILKNARLSQNTVLLIATKGFANNPTELLSDRAKSILPNNPIAFIYGPNIAKEVAQNLFTPATIACQDITIASKLAASLTSSQFMMNFIDDIVTLQVAGAIKNIIAIKSGLYDATGYGENAKAWLITQAVKEISILAKALKGGQLDDTVLLEAGVLGDLILTCYSKNSRNTKFGYELGRQENKSKFLSDPSYLVEGRESARLIIDLIRKYKLQMPVVLSVIKELGLVE